MSPASSPQQQQDDIMFRRREKRLHVTSNSIDLRDPYSVIALAIRFDEAMSGGEDESLLQVPLESGPIYNPKAFSKALLNLQNQTAVPRQASSSPRKVPQDSSPSASAPRQAIAPIILSGLVATIQERADHNDNINEVDVEGPSAVELVAYCRSMRRAALTRLRLRRRRRRVQRNVTPVILVAIVFSLVVWSTSSVRSTLQEYGFVSGDAGEGGSCQSNPACRLAAARVWEYCGPSHRLTITGCTLESCPALEGQLEYPMYAMHTLFHPPHIHISEIDHPRKLIKRTWPLRRHISSPAQSAIRWLGETVLNRVLRETILEYLPSNMPMHMLDCGCGIGGTLYAMLDSKRPPAKTFRYHGIALSEPEIYQAKQYLALHELDTPKAAQQSNSEIVFERRDYDEPLNRTYSVIVAMESLSYSPRLARTIRNLVSSLQSKGVLLIMDDVLAPWVSEEDAKQLREDMGTPSLKSYAKWERIITNMQALQLQYTYDLTLEFDMSEWLREEPAEGIFNILSDWRYHMAQTLGEYLTPWFGDSGNASETNSTLSLMQLVHNLAEKNRMFTARRDAYRRADLSYYFFAITKN